MKLIIRQGESVDNALKYLQDFFGQHKEEYPILKSNMNIYVDLEGFGHRICPENERELILTGEDPFDLFQSRKTKALNETMNRWRGLLMRNTKEIKAAQHNLYLDGEYLAAAEEKGKRPDQIEKRERLRSKHLRKMDELMQKDICLSRFNKALEEKKATIHYVKHQWEKSGYKYNLECVLVFDNIDGLCGYFDRNGLREGLPYNYQRIKKTDKGVEE